MDWLRLLIFTVLLFVMIGLVKAVLRKTLNIKKQEKEFFSYNYVSDSHKKVDRICRYASVIIYVPLVYFAILGEISGKWLLVGPILVTAGDYTVRAFFEWKQSAYPKQAVLTVSELTIIVMGFLAIFQFDILGLF
ncbi:DUF4181 domain-containing protein [Planococcus lenghuensis]|uniref:DUF4181 domain-containing protein n=1 Tax=Planococcus lenghuensis TaxID=2213202 RepID=A0A1Q2KYR6_9BACL|nr:DUF4181 domain-containing protein [Planococcus lenghuensis]AQQ53293.1 hypothetical protein B0X71_09510 [Planococcus lenghuensis]